METSRSFRAEHILLLLVATIFGGSTLTASNSQNTSSFEAKEPARDRIHQLLSDRKDDAEAVGSIFEVGDAGLPALVGALREGQQMERAARSLAYLGGPEERRILRIAIGAEKSRERKLLLSSFLAGALVEPASEEEWAFLKHCLTRYKNEDESFVSLSATLALEMNSTPQALRVLQTTLPLDKSQTPENEAAKEILKAIQWIKQSSSNKAVRSTDAGSDLEQIKKIVVRNAFYAGGERERLTVENVLFTRNKHRALVSAEIYRGPRDARGYDIVLQKTPDTWKIVGVWFSWVA